MPTRSQLSLFVPPHSGVKIETVRRVVDPVQSVLIPAHVTLCREDELAGLGLVDLRARLDRARHGPITLQFGPPERFGGHGMLMPCTDGTTVFQSLRQVVLAARDARPHAPHLTLAHPRNPKAPGNDLGCVTALGEGLSITFDEIHLIEQHDDAPWIVRGTVPLVAQSGAPQHGDF